MDIGAKLKKIREQNHYSQKEIADLLNISQKTYSNIESGKSNISIKHLAILSNFFDFNPILLLEENGIIFNKKIKMEKVIIKKEEKNILENYNEILKKNLILNKKIDELIQLINQLLIKLNKN